MIVWMTRPDAYEVYMGGDRSMDLWITRPAYSHVDVEDDFMGRKMFRDTGWCAAHSTAQRGRYLLKQDSALHFNVMHEVVSSLVPFDLPHDVDPYVWADTRLSGEDTNWRLLYLDRDWEQKCRVCYKRFLLEVNLRTNEVNRIDPQVFLRVEDAEDQRTSIITSSITPALASYKKRDIAGSDFIPF